MNRIAARTAVIWILVLALVGGMIFFLYEYQRDAREWIMFPGSPHVNPNGKLTVGVITDREGIVLRDLGEESFSEDASIRKALLHWIGDRESNISVPFLQRYAARMVDYDPLGGVYSFGQQPGYMELTLDAGLQTAAMEAMGSYKGTVAVYNYETGEILCAVTTPSFDPDELPDIAGDTTGTYTGAYMNRFVQSVYIPGSVFKVVTMAAALESVENVQELRFDCTGSYIAGDGDVTCEKAHGSQSLKEIFANSCNCSFAQLVEIIGPETLDHYVRQFGVVESVSFDGITTAEGNFEIVDATREQQAWSGIGQHKDQINPCSYLTFLGAIARGGVGVEPYVVSRVTVGEEVTYRAETTLRSRIMSEETAEIMRQFMRNNVIKTYGADNFPGLTVCAKTGTAEVGGSQKPNAVFAGFVTDPEYPIAFIAVIEDGGYGSRVAIPVVSKVLEACKELLDG